MRELFKKLINHILRGWEDYPPHPLMVFLPPIILELTAYFIALAILYQIGAYLWSII